MYSVICKLLTLKISVCINAFYSTYGTLDEQWFVHESIELFSMATSGN